MGAKLTIECSTGFLRKYWTELCNTRQHTLPYDAKGNKPVSESLDAGRREAKGRTVAKWKPPQEGWSKINVDGAYDARIGGGIGIVIRDDRGSVLLTAWKFIDRGQDAEEIEALACAEGLLPAKEWCLNRTVLETDCSSMARALSMQDSRARASNSSSKTPRKQGKD